MSRARVLAYTMPLITGLLLAGCASTGESEEAKAEKAIEQAMAEELAPATPEEIAEIQRADPLTRANFWAAEFRKDPTRLDVTIEHTRSLREIGSHERAIDVLTKTIPIHPASEELHLIMGRALLSEGRPAEAADVFIRAAALAPQDATAHAGLGLALDQIERHYDAQNAYRRALSLEPERVSTLTNYGLSLALSGNLDEAEAQLRTAAGLPTADARVRQNLALILGLQGRFSEMREIDPHAPKRTVEANLDTLKTMLAPTRDYGTLRDASEAYGPEPEAEHEAEAPAAPQLRGSLSP